MNISSEVLEMASRICRDYMNGAWKMISSKEIVVKKISGGLNNLLYLVALPSSHKSSPSEPSQVLLRLYGQIHGEQVIESLLTESVIFTLLSERGLGPKLYGVFPGGRLEQYIPARPLKTTELSDPTLSALIAENLAKIHAMNIPINKRSNWLWNTISRWLKTAVVNLEDIHAEDSHNQQIIKKLQHLNLSKEFEWLRHFLTQTSSPVVFCHNDLQEGNILLSHCDAENDKVSQPQLSFIDFEYSAYNYRGFDFANHFIEWTIDYTNNQFPYFSVNRNCYPSREQQLLFARAYLQHSCDQNCDNPTEEQEAALLEEVEMFTLASHFLWGLWSIVNAKISTICFGYWDFALARLEAYHDLKNSITRTRRISAKNEDKTDETILRCFQVTVFRKILRGEKENFISFVVC
ncbi:choline/ethanolamine kinase isoform X2 [Bacillus rossius redtenbacheri]